MQIVSSSSQLLQHANTYLVPRQRSTLTLEPTRNPRVLVGVIPDRHPNASADVLAGPNDSLVILLLLLELRGCDGEVHADIELSDRDVDTEVSEALEVLLDGGGELADDEMALGTNTIDGDSTLQHVLDEVVVSIGLGGEALQVVVVEL